MDPIAGVFLRSLAKLNWISYVGEPHHNQGMVECRHLFLILYFPF